MCPRKDSREADWDAKTFHYMWDLAQNVPEAGIHVQSKLGIVRCRDKVLILGLKRLCSGTGSKISTQPSRTGSRNSLPNGLGLQIWYQM